ncbi:cupin domain-containing protein [Saccharibacillus sp. CPCC 101409]|uniref:cupin domain-containing protein n=1 Tax=Saccharibacillus sp. CPCC 101409 TaxID=3058041 RepID=UPI0026719968|nr:cupin domain-containing protein [Saccharibacillus sp. CPCC 101409]MDO3410075.1 cupin domain-containing protein [Saccharibacillus sp. CPCC 101409]
MNDKRDAQFFTFEDDGIIPNNPKLPVILYPGALSDRAEWTESVFNSHGWRNSWENGVFDYHHYHSNTHEVLGVTQGTILIRLGGENGRSFDLKAGDVIVLPAGTGHKRITSSGDFRIVGAYPDGTDYNTRIENDGKREQAIEEIAHVPLPRTDPVYGDEGPLTKNWPNV